MRVILLSCLFGVSPICGNYGQDKERPNYDGKKAAAYAKEWALKRNPEYKEFENDCTNFVSQALLAGEWKMVQSTFIGRKDDDVWWYGGTLSDASYTWGGAQNLYNFLSVSKRGKLVNSEKELNIGDIVQLRDDKKHVYHTMLVTGSKDNELLLSYHTTDHLDEPLGSIVKRLPKGHSPIFWKVLYAE